MPCLACIIVLFLTTFGSQTADCQKSCVNKMTQDQLIPNYFDSSTSGDLKVTYGANSTVQCGDQMGFFDTIFPPTVTYDVQGKCDKVSVIFFDPDTIFLNQRGYLHWFNTNIPASTMAQGYKQGDAGDIVAKYIHPFWFLGTHRYALCVYCQQSYVDATMPPDLTGGLEARLGKNGKSLADTYQLGNPVSCTYFYSFLLKNSPLYSVATWFQTFDNKDTFPY